MILFKQLNGKIVRMGKTQFRKYFLHQKAIAQERARQKAIEEAMRLEREEG